MVYFLKSLDLLYLVFFILHNLIDLPSLFSFEAFGRVLNSAEQFILGSMIESLLFNRSS